MKSLKFEPTSINIIMRDESGVVKFNTSDGYYKVTVHGEQFTPPKTNLILVVHNTVKYNPAKEIHYVDSKEWTVSEKNSGMRATNVWDNKDEAIEASIKNLELHGMEEATSQIMLGITRHIDVPVIAEE